MSTYTRKIPTFAKSGRDSISAEINFFMLGITLIVLRGLKTLTTLKDLSFTEPNESSNILNVYYIKHELFAYPEITTIESMRFQPILK